MIYPTISIRQPWAWAILYAGKDIENRTWALPLKFHPQRPVLIHSGKKLDEPGYYWLDREADDIPYAESLPKGGIVGALVFSGMPPTTSAWAEEGMFHWHIHKSWPVPFFPCPGRLGFFNVDYPHHIEV